MAVCYVYSGAVGTATGASWANAKTTIAAGITVAGSGGTVYVAHDHAETSASLINWASLVNVKIICVNRAGSVPPVSADLRSTATVTTTGNTLIAVSGQAYIYGLIFTSGSGATGQANLNANNGAGGKITYENCSLRVGTTATTTVLTVSSGAKCSTVFNNTSVQFGNASQKISAGLRFHWKNTSSPLLGATIPTYLIALGASGNTSLCLLEGLDLSALTTALCLPGNGDLLIKDCKLNSGVANFSSAPTVSGDSRVYLIRSASSGNVATSCADYAGTQTTETTIVRTGGASDGTTGVANKIVTTAAADPLDPFNALPIPIWNDTSGSSRTVTLYGIWGGGAVPNNDDIWFDLEYPGASGDPQGGWATCGVVDPLASNAALTSDSSTWGGSTTKFKMTVTVTPQQKGWFYIYPKAGKPSATFYIDPSPDVT